MNFLVKSVVKMDEKDNVAIALHDLKKGEKIQEITLQDNIPQAHKIALCDLKKGDSVIRYGVVLGYAKDDIKAGSWINENSLNLPDAPGLFDMEYGTNIVENLPDPPRTTFMGYDNPNSEFAGTRNILAIHTTVQCVVGILRVAVEKIKKELLPKYPNVDDVVLISHAYGCGVAIDAPEAKIPIRAIRNIMKNPNFGGELMVVGLGCEKLTGDKVMTPEEFNDDNFILFQEHKGFRNIMEAVLNMAEKKLKNLDKRTRTELPISKLSVGLQCGGSDAFSGVTANPSTGFASDMLVKGGATVMFSEVTEVRDGVPFIAQRVLAKPDCDKLSKEMSWYDDYLKAGGVDRSANPSPGNKAGGLSTIVEKSMGSIAKSGSAPISQVVSAGEIPSKHGLIFNATPASDFVCGTMQLASGMGVQVFMTGRGTPYNLEAAPVIKVCSRSDLKEQWNDLIDIDAGTVATGERTISEVGTEIFNKILDVASGEQPLTEEYGLFNDICIFNPAPIT